MLNQFLANDSVQLGLGYTALDAMQPTLLLALKCRAKRQVKQMVHDRVLIVNVGRCLIALAAHHKQWPTCDV